MIRGHDAAMEFAGRLLARWQAKWIASGDANLRALADEAGFARRALERNGAWGRLFCATELEAMDAAMEAEVEAGCEDPEAVEGLAEALRGLLPC